MLEHLTNHRVQAHCRNSFSVPLPLTEHHLDRNAGAQIELAALDQRFARPGDARSQLQEQPLAVDAAAEDYAQPIVDDLRFTIGLSDDAGLVGESSPITQAVIERHIGIPPHTLRVLSERARTGPAHQVVLRELPLQVDPRRRAEVFLFLPKDRFPQTEQIAAKEGRA